MKSSERKLRGCFGGSVGGADEQLAADDLVGGLEHFSFFHI